MTTLSHAFVARLTAEEKERLETLAKRFNSSQNEIIRTLLNASDGAQKEQADPASAEKLDELSERVQRLSDSFSKLVTRIADVIAKPSFFEYRARQTAQGNRQRDGESKTDYVLRLAEAYYAQYGYFPTPDDGDTIFGPTSGINTEAFKQRRRN